MKLFKILIIGLITGVFITTVSCKKYEDGPLLNIHGKIQRIAAYWDVESFTVNGVDSTSYLKSQPSYGWYTFGRDKATGVEGYNFHCATDFNGYWQFKNRKNDVYIHLYNYTGGAVGPYGANDITWEIRKLTIPELWLKTVYSGKEYFVKFKRQKI